MLGVVLIRFAANGLIAVIERFPRLQLSAYLLVLLIGGKLVLDYAINSGRGAPAIDFQSASSPAFWAFWLLMIACLACGFFGPQRNIVSR
jgi:predicted tellurium resistance membrane protein TerC